MKNRLSLKISPAVFILDLPFNRYHITKNQEIPVLKILVILLLEKLYFKEYSWDTGRAVDMPIEKSLIFVIRE